MSSDRTDLEIQGKLQVKVGRTLLRAKLIMFGNVLLVAWLISYVLLLLWYVVYLQAGSEALMQWAAAPFGVTLAGFQKLNLVAMTALKLSSLLLLFCPGLACRLCGEAMKP